MPMKIITAAALAFVLSTPAMAQESASNPDNAAPEAARAEIVTDDPPGTVRIVIDGHIVALFGEEGLHVRENINSGGYQQNYGRKGFGCYQ